MKKLLTVIAVFLVALGAADAQTANPLPQMDAAVKALAGDITRRLAAEKAQKIAISEFSFKDYIPSLSPYWANQLGLELTTIPNKPFAVLADAAAGADWIISGEIVEIGAAIRVYTRLVRLSDRSVAAVFPSDFERNQHVVEMLSDTSSGGRRSSRVPRDAWEPDSWEHPVSVEIGADENAPAMNRSLHDENDEDFFLLLPGKDGRLLMETTGGTDTYMEFYNAETGEKLAEDDDSGSRSNARIRYNVQAAKRYIAKVRGYDGNTGHYGFRAYYTVQILPDEYEPDDDSSTAKWINIGTPQQHTFHTGDDVDWVKFQITQPGRYTIRARGVATTDLDTHIELFDKDLTSIAKDDDGGEGYDSRLSLRLESGLYYLKVKCLDDDPDEPYTISIEEEER